MLLERDNKRLIAMARKEYEQSIVTLATEEVPALVANQKRAHGKKGVALVVGASRGIGRQVAIDLAKEGYAGTCHSLP